MREEEQCRKETPDRIDGDWVMVAPREEITLALAGEYGLGHRHPLYRVEKQATNPRRVHHDELLLGSSEHYVVRVLVRNRGDSPALVRLVLAGS